ncbi:Kiwa anti-phage protein KwaB-like domain-containing protein [Roseiconus sp. JC912]|uniref:Kiwa anti-phage protein KwaB-like domain-containing protein n=2 Tax=Pirellulaceae TaxID=2691357 RepID=UPI003A4C683D
MAMHFFVVVGHTVKRMRVDNTTQNTLIEMFSEQYDQLLENRTRVAFDGSYNIDETEVYELSKFDIDASMIDAVKQPQSPDDFNLKTDEHIKAIFAGDYDRKANMPTIYFQSFNKGRLLKKGFTLLGDGNTLKENKKAGITLDTKLAGAVVDGKLLFRNYRTMNSIVDISKFYNEATNEQIDQVLEHDRLLVEDADAVRGHVNSWMRRRFTAILQSGVLDTVTPRKISGRAKKYGLEVNTKKVDDKDAIVFPTDKKQIKSLLTFLNEGYFEGELTGTLFQTNSQRKV